MLLSLRVRLKVLGRVLERFWVWKVLGQVVGQASGFPVSCTVRCWGVSPELLSFFGLRFFASPPATSVSVTIFSEPFVFQA